MPEEETMNALMKSLHNKEIKTINVHEVMPLAIKIMSNRTQASEEEVRAAVNSFDKNNDGKFDIEELPVAVENHDPEQLAAEMIQSGSNSTGSWVDVWLGSFHT